MRIAAHVCAIGQFAVAACAAKQVAGIYLLSASLVLAGCFGPSPSPVRDQSDSVVQQEPVRVVRHGETLYSIAWSAGKDPQEIARLNKLQAPYRIQAGQKLKLGNASSSAAGARSTSKPLGRKGQRDVPAKRAPATKDPAAAPKRWLWPARGKVIAAYNPASGRKGLDIVGPAGSAVVSTAAGRVVYAGGGLRGFGRMIIIKHGDRFLSAYGHNRKLLVAEGEWVDAGQRIAEMGTVNRNNPQLHFEIRRDGKPVDPARYLPKRK